MAAPGGSWKIVQAYSTSSTFNWSTTGAAAGTYSLSVWVRDASSIGTTADGGGRYDARRSGSYTLATTASSPSPQVPPVLSPEGAEGYPTSPCGLSPRPRASGVRARASRGDGPT